MPEFYMMIARKIFFPIFFEGRKHVPPAPLPRLPSHSHAFPGNFYSGNATGVTRFLHTGCATADIIACGWTRSVVVVIAIDDWPSLQLWRE